MTRYELLERIGVGGMAEIFRGKAIAGRGFEKPVAIKRILPHLSEDKRFVELLITEAKTLSELKHRNIVQIYDVGLGDDNQYFIVMEFVDGLDLSVLWDDSISRGRPLMTDACLYICAEVCEALEHAHNARRSDGASIGLVHRDVSPSNILVSKSGEVKLTDFGIAKRVEELTGHGDVRGKFAYISPEQAENQHVDARSDVHSLGIVLFELITNRSLFSHMPDFDALKAVREHQMPNIADVDISIDATLAKLVMKALAFDPNDRFQSAKDFASALRDYRYGMVSSTGDPAQVVARAVRESVHEASSAEQLPPGERTVVRIMSSSGFPGATAQTIDLDEVSTDAEDAYAGARSVLDSFDDDKTKLARTPAPELPVHSGRDTLPPDDSSTKIASPRGKRRESVDPDAETEYALASAASRPGSEGVDEIDLETRVLDRNDPLIAAALIGGSGRADEVSRDTPLPPLPSPRDVSGVDESLTVPRTKPVGPKAPVPSATIKSTVKAGQLSAPLAPLAPRNPYPPAMDASAVHDGDRFLGMPRQVAYWVLGAAAALLVLTIIALLATRPSEAELDARPDGDGAPELAPESAPK